MKDVKTLNQMAGDDNWPFLPFVEIAATVPANAIQEGASQTQGEEVVQSWGQIAVLEIAPNIPVYFGFKAGNHGQFLNVPIEVKDDKFGVRVGDGDVTFFVIPADLKSRPTLKLVEVTSIDDPNYEDLPLY